MITIVYFILIMLAVNTIGTILSIRVFISLFLFCISTAIILVTLSAEYFGLIYLLVYMGAIIMLFLFIIMLLDIYEFDEGFEFKETQIILILLSLKVGLLFEKVLFFGNSIIDVTLSEPHFSIFEFFICFYNINYILLIFIGIVLFFVMIGVVDSLVNNYQDILSISKSNLKLFVYSGFVFLEKRNEDEDYDIVDSIFLMPFKFLFTGRWGWDIYVTPHLNTDPPPPAPPLYHSQTDYFDKYIRWDVMQRNYVRTNLFKYVLEGDALIGYFVISFVVIMFFLWFFSFVSTFRFLLLFVITWLFGNSILYNLTVYYPNIEKIRCVRDNPTEGLNPFKKGMWHELFYGERPFLLRFLECINPINEPLLANHTFPKYDLGLLLFYGSILYITCFILVWYLCKYHFKGSWALISIFLVVWFIEGLSVTSLVTPVTYFLIRLIVFGFVILARYCGVEMYEGYQEGSLALNRGLFLHYELCTMKMIDKVITHAYYLGLFFSASYFFAIWNWKLIGTDVLYILFFKYHMFSPLHEMLIVMSILWGVFFYFVLCRALIASPTFKFFTAIEGLGWITFCLSCCGIVWTTICIVVFFCIFWLNNYLFDDPFYDDRLKKTFERMAPVMEAEVREERAVEGMHRIISVAAKKRRKELWKKLSWKQKINIIWQRAQRFWKLREPANWEDAIV